MNPIYLALGDSLTTGYGVELSRGFSSLYFSWLSQNSPTFSYANEGINGLTSLQLARLLAAEPRKQNLMTQAWLITITIGSNDFLHLARRVFTGCFPDIPAFLNRFQADMIQVGQILRHLNHGARIQIASLYNPLPAGPYRQYTRQGQTLLNEANAILGDWARQFGAALVPVGAAFRGQESLLIGADHVHPNVNGHALMAGLFAKGR